MEARKRLAAYTSREGEEEPPGELTCNQEGKAVDYAGVRYLMLVWQFDKVCRCFTFWLLALTARLLSVGTLLQSWRKHGASWQRTELKFNRACGRQTLRTTQSCTCAASRPARPS